MNTSETRPATSPAAPPTPESGPLGQMAARMPLIMAATTWEEVDPRAHEEWDAPYGPAEQWDVAVEERQAPGPHGPVPVRIYTPRTRSGAGARACLVWCHGGGFMHGDLDMPEADHVSRGVAGRADAVVVSVDYRLCDEPPERGGNRARAFPGTTGEVRAPMPLDDVCAAMAWVHQNAEALGIDADRIAIGGASAGGNLAAATSLRLADEGSAPAASLLMYPVAHPLSPEPTAEEAEALAGTPSLLGFSRETMRSMSSNYIGRPLEEAAPYDFPGLASTEQLARLPRTYIEADEFDDLRVSARRYAEQLREAGVDTQYVVRRGVSHGHLNRVGLIEAQQSMDALADIVREL